MGPYNPAQDASLLTYPVGSKTYQYLLRLVDVGVFEGPLGDMDLAASVKPIVDALHEVLAGGEVKIHLVRKGSPDVVNDLTKKLADAQTESNTLNGKAGYYLTVNV